MVKKNNAEDENMTIFIPTDCMKCKFRQRFAENNQLCTLFDVNLPTDKASGIPVRCMQCASIFPGGGRFNEVREDTFTPAEIGNMCNPVLCAQEVNNRLLAQGFQKKQSAVDGEEWILLQDGEFYGRCGVINTEAGRVLRVVRWIRETVDICNAYVHTVRQTATVAAGVTVISENDSEELFPVTLGQRIERSLDTMQKEILEDIRSRAPVPKMRPKKTSAAVGRVSSTNNVD